MKLKELRAHFVGELANYNDENEVLSFFYMLTESWLTFGRVDVSLHLEENVVEVDLIKFNEAIIRLKAYEPIQYVLGEAYFYGMTFKVDKNVLIPRPETEELVDWILKDSSETGKKISILDIGTGSGCIAISLAKKMPNATVYALDISDKSLQVAKENARQNNVVVNFMHSDVLKLNTLSQDFDIIVSNPPYVRDKEKKEMNSNVLDNEPHGALFVSDHSPLVFYKKITELAINHLHKEGVLYFEINQYLGNKTVELIHNLGFAKIALRKDIYENDRMIKAQLQ